MKLLISFLISIFLLSSNIYSSENARENVIKLNDNTQMVKPKISEEQFRELIRKLPNKENIRDTYKETSNDFMEFVKKLRPLLVPAIIIIWLMSRSSNKSEDKPKQNKKTKVLVLELKNLLSITMKVTIKMKIKKQKMINLMRTNGIMIKKKFQI